MKTKILFLAAAAAMAFTAASCSKDDGDPSDPRNKVPDPEGTVELNMRNEDNGKTKLSSIYIDAANNFTNGDYYPPLWLADLGEMSGLGNIVKFTTTGESRSCSVYPGHGYLAFSGSRLFPSGATAYNVGQVYRIYVDSWITGTSGGILGAKIKYQHPFDPYGLPHTWEEYSVADADAKGWEVEQVASRDSHSILKGYSYYIRCDDLYVSFYHSI